MDEVARISAPARRRTVTPFLFLGSAPAGLEDVSEVATAADAASVLLAGGTAVLPMDAWAEAEAALLLIEKNTPEAVAKQLRFARTGRTH